MRRTWEQFLAVFNSLAPSQRITFTMVALLVPVGFLFFAWNGSSSSMIPLSYGKVFGLDEMRNAEQSLKEAGLTKFRSEGRQILAPAGEVERYNAALLQSGSLPSHWAEELEKKMESTNALTSSSESLKHIREALLAKALRRMILASPDFEDAEVFWTPLSSARSRFSRDARMKATVAVKPRSGRELTTRQVQALRDAVTSAIGPDLKAADVTVYDQRKGESYASDADNDPLGGKVLALLREYSQTYERKIKDALLQISPDVLVTVNVEIDPLQRSITQSVKYDSKKSLEQQVTEQKRRESFRQQPLRAEPGSRPNQPLALATAASSMQDRTVQDETSTTIRSPGGETTYTEQVPALPKVVTVSVAIPESYYARALELQNGTPSQGKPGGSKTIEKIKEETEQTVRNIVAGAIPNPDPNNPNLKNVTVSSYVPVKEEVPEVKTPPVELVMSLVSQWGGAVGLGLFALWAIWMLRGTMPKSTAPAAPPDASVNAFPGSASQAKKEREEIVPEEEPIPTLDDRDLVQNMVRDNPEMAVAIIGKWLQASQ